MTEHNRLGGENMGEVANSANTSVEEACRLCGILGPLRESHIVPAFVFRWLKSTSATGYIRYTQELNRRKQDGAKLYLLCEKCEQRFSDWEKEFSQTIFQPRHSEDRHTFTYNHHLLLFGASLVWRATLYFAEVAPPEHLRSEQQRNLIAAQSVWREFLLGELPNPGSFEIHLVPFDLINDHTLKSLSGGINFYLMRSVALDILSFDDEGGGAVYVKLPAFAFLGFVKAPARSSFVSTRLAVKRGKFGTTNITIPISLISYMNEKADEVLSIPQKLSEKQRLKIDKAFENTERVIPSKTFEAMAHDYQLSGGTAFIKPDKPQDS